MLSDTESEVDDVHQLVINEHFAKAYARKKEREELSKLKDKYGSDAGEDEASEDDSEDDETEDEDGEELTPAVDAAILRTLARIRKKDPAIYDKDKSIFEEEQSKTRTAPPPARAQRDKAKPLLMRQHVLNSVLDQGSRSQSPVPLPTHAEEQVALRDETITAFHSAVTSKRHPQSSDDDDDEDLLIPREKTKDEMEREAEEYRDFLAREVGEDIGGLVTIEETPHVAPSDEEAESPAKTEQDGEKKKKKKKKKKAEAKKESDHEFLMNYILNRGWIDKSTRHVPTYSEVTGTKAFKQSMQDVAAAVRDGDGDIAMGDSAAPDEGLVDEEEFDDVADTFESSYNFRFEEPDAAVIPAHPRQIDALVRRQDTTRKEARERKKARKEEKLLKKREEVKRMKALKMRDLREKLERIGKEGGKTGDDEALAELDLEGEWDPEAHDRQMASIYDDGDEGVHVEEADADVDDAKPTWDDDIDIGDIMPPQDDDGNSTNKKKKKKKKKGKASDGDDADAGVDVDAMDADVERPPPEEEVEWDGTEEMRKRTLDAYMDEVYGLEFNDLVGDLPTRFKYMPVAQQTFGLTPAEILMAPDTELNTYLGLKAYAPYRRAGVWDGKRGERLKELKEKVRDQVAGAFGAGVGGNEAGVRPPKKRKGKKERQKAKVVDEPGRGDGEAGGGQAEKPSSTTHEEGPAKKKRRQHKKSAEDS